MYAQRLLVITTFALALALAEDNPIDFDENAPWTGLWFPENPEISSKDQANAHASSGREESSLKQISSNDQLNAHAPGDREQSSLKQISTKKQVNAGDREQSSLIQNEDNLQVAESKFNGKTEGWKGKWFPVLPGQSLPKTPATDPAEENRLAKLESTDGICDDGTNNLHLDYDPRNITHHYRHLCIDERKLYAPSYDIQPRLLDYTIPPEYSALQKCTDEEIVYADTIPTFGAHRKLWPVYGEYVFVPPQRWIHSLEHGAIVLLYHPCANLNQLDMVKDLVKKCLYRHIISAYDLLEPERPFALVAWGRSFEFSVVDQLAVVSFIRLYGLQGPEKISSDGQYNQTLIEQSNIVTSPDDIVLCQNL